jgi:hypothetical protein
MFLRFAAAKQKNFANSPTPQISGRRITAPELIQGDGVWPELPYRAWQGTAATLQLWTQIAGKIRLALTPWTNHSWHVPLYVTVRGLSTSPIPAEYEMLEIEFDFIKHQLVARMSDGREGPIALEPQSVAEFYQRMMALMAQLGVKVHVNEIPNELPNPIAFSQDQLHRSYDADAAHRFWRILIQADRVLKLFRSGYLGKASPVHFFWGSFDLAVTRFSGRRAPLHPGGVPHLPDAVAREAYSHEVSSAGFWPGNDVFPQAAFYSYAYPEPPGFRDSAVTSGAYFDKNLGEFILPYDVVRSAADPDAVLLDFLASTYTAAANAGHWDRAALECEMGAPGRVRRVTE